MQVNKIILYLFLTFAFFSCKNNNTPVAEKNAVEIEETKKETRTEFIFKHELRLPQLNSGKKAPLLIMLHGRGSNEKDLFPFADHVDNRLIVVTPRGPLTLGNNKFAWFDLSFKEGKFHYIESEIDTHRKMILEYVDQLIEAYDANPNAVYIGGFSQGAIMSLYAAMTAPEKFDGIYCMSGQMYPNFKSQMKSGPAFNELDILITHGKKDNVLPFEDIKKSALFLKTSGAKVETKWYDVGHTVSSENINDLVYWLSTLIDKHK